MRDGTVIRCDGGTSADGACGSFVALDIATPGAPEAQMFALSREGWAFDRSWDWCPAHNGCHVEDALIARARIWQRLHPDARTNAIEAHDKEER